MVSRTPFWIQQVQCWTHAAFVWNHGDYKICQFQFDQRTTRWLILFVFFSAFRCTTCLCTWILLATIRRCPVQMVVWGLSQCYFTHRIGRWSGGEGLRDVHWHMHPHRTRTTNRSISSSNRDINLSFFCPKFDFQISFLSPLDHNKTWERTLSWLLARKQYLIIAHAAALTEAHTKREIYLERENSIHIYASRLHPQYTFNLFLQHRDEYFIHSKWGWSTCTCRRAQDFQTNPQLLGCWQLPQVSRGNSQNTHRARRNRGWHNAMVV